MHLSALRDVSLLPCPDVAEHYPGRSVLLDVRDEAGLFICT